ncbi:MAG: hypothetical protein ACOCRO_09405 [Halanaerobiales bacterium]
MSEKKPETTVVQISDMYSSCIDDSTNVKKEYENRRPKGYVEVYDIDNSIDLNDNDKVKESINNGTFLGSYIPDEAKVKKNNLIVFDGREWLISSMFSVDNNNISRKSEDRIYWVGFGSGGAPEEDPFSPTSPDQDDDDLYESVMINESEAEYGDHRTSPEEGHYKKLFSQVQYERDDLNDDRYLVAKITITLTSADANDSLLNEAGLFIASEDSSGYNGDFHLFSRVTFPSISKTESRQLVFIWYVYS